MKKSLKLFVLISLLLGCQNPQTNDSEEFGWKLAYKHDKHGKALFGSKDKVLEAVRNGLSIRVGYGRQTTNDRSIEHIADAQFLSIISIPNSKEVFAQISPIMRQGPFRLNDTVGIKLEPGFKWLTAIGTNGMSSNVMVNSFKDSLDGSNQNRRGALWFVEYPPHFKANNQSLISNEK